MNPSVALLKATLDELQQQAAKPLRSRPQATKAYLGYVAAMGPSLRRIGLPATLALYRTKDGDGDEPLKPLYDFLYRLLLREDAALFTGDERAELLAAGELFTYATHRSGTSTSHLRPRLNQAIVATKLALRTYPLPQKETSNE